MSDKRKSISCRVIARFPHPCGLPVTLGRVFVMHSRLFMVHGHILMVRMIFVLMWHGKLLKKVNCGFSKRPDRDLSIQRSEHFVSTVAHSPVVT